MRGLTETNNEKPRKISDSEKGANLLQFGLMGSLYAERARGILARYGVLFAFIAVKEPADWRAVLDTWYAEDLPGLWPATVDETYYSQ